MRVAAIKQRSLIALWCDVIFAIFIREIRTGFNDKFGLVWAIVSPLSFIFALAFMRGIADSSEVHGIPIFIFMLYGMLYLQLFLGVMEKTAGALRKHRELFAFRQVQPMSAFISAALFEMLVKIVVSIVIYVILIMIKVEHRIDFPIELLFSFVLIVVNALSVGIIFAVIEMKITEFTKIRGMLIRPLFFISGAFFSLQDFSEDIWPYLNWNPILQGIELARGSAYHEYGYHGVSFGYLATFTIVSLFLSLMIYHISWKSLLSR